MEDYLYVLCAIVAVLILVILMYTGSVYVMREKSFESALVEQSGSRRELLEQTSNKHEKKMRRQHVRGKHVEKSHTENTDQGVVSAGTPVHHSPSKKHVELELEPKVIVEDIEDKNRKPSSPSKPAKSILLNKEEKGQISPSMAVPELFRRHTSVDELDLKVERRKSDLSLLVPENEENLLAGTETVSKAVKKKKSKTSVSQEIQEIESNACQLASAKGSGNESQIILPSTTPGLLKSAADVLETSTNSVVVDPVLPNESNKQAKQLQTLVDKLTKQLSEKEKDLVKEKSRLAASNDQICELQQELATAKHRIEESVAQKRKLEAESEKLAAVELSKTNEKHARAVNDFQTNVEVLKSELVKISQTNMQLLEENRLLKDANHHRMELAQKMAILEDALQKSSVTMATNENTKKHLEGKLCQYEEKISQLSTHLKDVNSQNLELLKEVQQFNKTKEQLCTKHSSEIQHLENCLKESEMTKMKFESQAVALQCRLMEIERRLMKTVPVEYELCTHNGTTNESQNVSQSCTKQEDISNSDSTHQVELADKNEDINQLKQLLNEQQHKNEELRQKNYAIMNALSEMEKMAQQSVGLKDECEKKSIELNRLRSELKDLKSMPSKHFDGEDNRLTNKPRTSKSNQQSGEVVSNGGVLINDLARTSNTQVDKATLDEVARLKTLLEAQTKKNDELRQKNYMVLDALAKVEKVAESSVRLKDQLTKKESELQLLSANHPAAFQSNTFDPERDSSNKFNKLDQRVDELRAEINEKDTRIMKLETELAQVKLSDSDTCAPLPSEQGVGRKEVTFVTHIQETTSWDMSQLVLDLDTKTAELHILQSLLEQNEDALRAEKLERSKVNELVDGLRSQLAQKDSVIQQQFSQSKNVIDKCSNKQNENPEPQSLVHHYKTVLRETEGMLSSLQASVEKEESSWRSRIAAVEDELHKERLRAKCLDEKLAVIQNRHQV